jgi:hypothetical protein
MINALTPVMDSSGKFEDIWRGGHPNLPEDIAGLNLRSVILLNDDSLLHAQDDAILSKLAIITYWKPLSGVIAPSVDDLEEIAYMIKTMPKPLALW